LKKTIIVGLPDAAVKEAGERVQAAVRNSGFRFPDTHTTVNLAPADLRKEGPSFDLPIALGVIACTEIGASPQFRDTVVVGELALDGTVRRPIAGPVAALLERMAGTEVALLMDPPALVFDAEPDELPLLPSDWIRIRSGVHAGLEGRVIALIGPRRFAANVLLEAARVAIDDDPPLDVPIGDLERFV
jgi:hypothetical protein